MHRRGAPADWLRTVGVTLLTCVAVCGWYYGRIWYSSGTPLVDHSLPGSGITACRQDPGYGTTAYLLRFGRSLDAPFSSAVNGFPDGVYATLWGDGMQSAEVDVKLRPPWNYHLMTVGYLLALFPTLLIAIGAVLALIQLVRQPRAEWFLLVGLAFFMSAAMLHHFLRLPSYSSSNADQGLGASLAVCAFAALGFDLMPRANFWRWPRFLLATALGVWALTALASFWVLPGSVNALTWESLDWSARTDALKPSSHSKVVVRHDPRTYLPPLHLSKAGSQSEMAPTKAMVWRVILRDDPENVEAHLKLGLLIQGEGKLDEAVLHLRRTVELAPDHPTAHVWLGQVLSQQKRRQEAASAFREALRVTPWQRSVIQTLWGDALAGQGNAEEALVHYRTSLNQPHDDPYTLNRLAWILATHPQARLRDGAEALRLANRVYELTEGSNPVFLDSLAAAHAELGQFDRATQVLQQALQIAASTGQTALIEPMQQRLKLYRAGQPYHEQSWSRD